MLSQDNVIVSFCCMQDSRFILLKTAISTGMQNEIFFICKPWNLINPRLSSQFSGTDFGVNSSPFGKRNLWKMKVCTANITCHFTPSAYKNELALSPVNDGSFSHHLHWGYSSLSKPGIALGPVTLQLDVSPVNDCTHLLCFWWVFGTIISFIFCNKIFSPQPAACSHKNVNTLRGQAQTYREITKIRTSAKN